MASNFVPGFSINWEYIWPLFLILPGVFFWIKYLATKSRTSSIGLLIPANILICLGITFYINIIGSNIFGLNGIWVATAFMYPGSVALAFWITWVASRREVVLLVPAMVTSAISLLILCSTSLVGILGGAATAEVNRVLWPVLIICLGVFVLLSPFWAVAFRNDQRWMGKTSREWEAWGKEFGKKVEEWGDKVEKSQSQDSTKPAQADEAEVVTEKRIKK